MTAFAALRQWAEEYTLKPSVADYGNLQPSADQDVRFRGEFVVAIREQFPRCPVDRAEAIALHAAAAEWDGAPPGEHSTATAARLAAWACPKPKRQGPYGEFGSRRAIAASFQSLASTMCSDQ